MSESHHDHDHHHHHAPNDTQAAIGIVANPMSGRDVRRLAARAPQQTPESKRNQIQRAAIGAVAAGAGRVVLAPDCFRISQGAAESLHVDAEIELLDFRNETKPSDTLRTVELMRERGCKALIVLGGDGTNRLVASAWPDATVVPISTGTNNVFPEMLEATSAGAAAGLVASGRIALEDVAQRAKIIEAEFPEGLRDFAVIDAAILADDHPGSLLPFRPEQVRQLVLTRAEPTAVGMSPIGGFLHPCGRSDDFGVEVRCSAPDGGGRPLLVPVSPGLYGNAHVLESSELKLDRPVPMQGPGVIAFDGDRMRMLRSDEQVIVRITRQGPWVIDVRRTLSLAAQKGLFFDRHWHDHLIGAGGGDCC